MMIKICKKLQAKMTIQNECKKQPYFYKNCSIFPKETQTSKSGKEGNVASQRSSEHNSHGEKMMKIFWMENLIPFKKKLHLHLCEGLYWFICVIYFFYDFLLRVGGTDTGSKTGRCSQYKFVWHCCEEYRRPEKEILGTQVQATWMCGQRWRVCCKRWTLQEGKDRKSTIAFPFPVSDSLP